MSTPGHGLLLLDGETLSLPQLRRFGTPDGGRSFGISAAGHDQETQRPNVELAPEARRNVLRSVEVVREAVRTDRVSYGITTGFGAFANKRISANQVRQLQLNLVRSHACGIGEPLAAPLVRRMLLLKANSLAAGISGVRTELVDALLALLNNDVLPVIPSPGSVGASGDLAPLAHLSLCLIGEGEATQNGRRLEGAEVCRAAGLE